MAKHPHKIRSKLQHSTLKTRGVVKHADSTVYYAGSGVLLDFAPTRQSEWPQSDRISWVKQRRLEHAMQEHEGKSAPERCVLCQDYEIWLRLQKPKVSQRLVAAKMFGSMNPKAALSRVYRAKERVEKDIPGTRTEKEPLIAEPITSSPPMNEPSDPNTVLCSCGAVISARTRKIALRALMRHQRQNHCAKRPLSSVN
jgi:hypothetical protein